nr:hypothetical protein [uncultured Oscillibacter sp.]
MKNAMEMLKGYSLEKLLELWDLTENMNSPEVPVVRGWLMDEIAARNPEGFDAWLDLDFPEDKDLRRYVLN